MFPRQGGRLRSVFPDEADGLDILMFWRTGKGQVGMAPLKRRGKTIVWTKFLKEERSQAKIGLCVCITDEGGCIWDFFGGRLNML